MTVLWTISTVLRITQAELLAILLIAVTFPIQPIFCLWVLFYEVAVNMLCPFLVNSYYILIKNYTCHLRLNLLPDTITPNMSHKVKQCLLTLTTIQG